MPIDVSIELNEVSVISQTELFLSSALKSVEEMMRGQVQEYHPDLKAATHLVMSAGGKRLRPKLILLIGKMLGVTHEPLLYLASAIEMLHTATLVHDDLIDGSLMRRGKETINARWSPAATVLTGDFLFAAASDMASRTGSVEVMHLISRSLMTIVNGEVNQLFRDARSTTVENYYRVIYAKTASLFETSTHAAGVISPASARQVEVLRQFGYNLGMAFQIIDDVLDYTGNAGTVGKPVGMDLRQGLVTLPLLHYMRLNPDDPAVSKLKDGRSFPDEGEVEALLKAVRSSEALERTMGEARNFAACAEDCLCEVPAGPEREMLVEITRDSVGRKL